MKVVDLPTASLTSRAATASDDHRLDLRDPRRSTSHEHGITTSCCTRRPVPRRANDARRHDPRPRRDHRRDPQCQGVIGGTSDPHAAYLLDPRAGRRRRCPGRAPERSSMRIAEMSPRTRRSTTYTTAACPHPGIEIARRQMKGLRRRGELRDQGRPRRTTSRASSTWSRSADRAVAGRRSRRFDRAAVADELFELTTEERRLAVGIKDNLIRLSVGLAGSGRPHRGPAPRRSIAPDLTGAGPVHRAHVGSLANAGIEPRRSAARGPSRRLVRAAPVSRRSSSTRCPARARIPPDRGATTRAGRPQDDRRASARPSHYAARGLAGERLPQLEVARRVRRDDHAQLRPRRRNRSRIQRPPRPAGRLREARDREKPKRRAVRHDRRRQRTRASRRSGRACSRRPRITETGSSGTTAARERHVGLPSRTKLRTGARRTARDRSRRGATAPATPDIAAIHSGHPSAGSDANRRRRPVPPDVR